MTTFLLHQSDGAGDFLLQNPNYGHIRYCTSPDDSSTSVANCISLNYSRRFHETFECQHREEIANLRLTVDTKEDFELIRKIFEALYSEGSIFTFADIVNLFNQNPDLSRINQNIMQKPVR